MATTINLFERLNAPSVAPGTIVSGFKTLREAIVASWENRSVKNMTRRALAEKTGMRDCHLPDYLDPRSVNEKGREHRDMPAKYLPGFESAVGNSFASQWLAMQSQLTILEAQIAEQRAR